MSSTTVTTENSQQLPRIPSGDVTTAMLFAQSPKDGSKPYMYIKCPPPPNVPMTNIRMIPQSITIKDLRGNEDSVDLDNDSVKVIRHFPSEIPIDFDDEEAIKRDYYPLVEQQMRQSIPGDPAVHIFRHAIRHTKDPKRYGPPAAIAHLDQMPDAVVNRVKMHLGDQQSARLLKGRYRLVHHWRVINAPAYSFPLAFARSASVRDEDILPLITHLPDFSEHTGSPVYHQNQQWCYLSGCKPSEALLLQMFDSKAQDPNSGVKGGRAIHGSFNDPRTPKDAPHRFSIEVSALVFTDE